MSRSKLANAENIWQNVSCWLGSNGTFGMFIVKDQIYITGKGIHGVIQYSTD
jgi:formate-dependent phosphoribosylglycinamide formyltransferase (GAR transformylase)